MCFLSFERWLSRSAFHPFIRPFVRYSISTCTATHNWCVFPHVPHTNPTPCAQRSDTILETKRIFNSDLWAELVRRQSAAATLRRIGTDLLAEAHHERIEGLPMLLR